MPLQDVRSLRIFLEALLSSFTLLFICHASENVVDESERLANAVYHVDFVGTNLSFQRSLIIIMQQTQKPLVIKAGSLIDVSLVTYTAILRASYSSYTMLKAVHTNNA
ncbi:hypothetical protein RN001_011316 [Aquatica leii]|uniref:Uncharacterized protein n=1 Tax=Aquatica leii TaxID=1421715 RepID=A0AAN7Q3Z5_9COLE|nr:hypothetical protein RN001_011316 [Aquatica leii]